jgi:uncharacterized membrane protein
MSKFVVVVFSDEPQAYNGARALKELDSEGSLTLYGMAVLAKDAKGAVAIRQAVDIGPLGTALGAVVGGLIGVIGGPVGALAGAAGGAWMGAIGDLFNYGVGADFVSTVSDELAPGNAAIIAEIGEDWTTPLDTRMEALGGTVMRTWRDDFEDNQIEKEIAAARAELDALRAERAEARQEAKARLDAKIEKAKGDLQKAQDRAKARLASLHQETQAKVGVLEKQFADARGDARERINTRIAALRADYEKRSAKLNEARKLTIEALAA